MSEDKRDPQSMGSLRTRTRTLKPDTGEKAARNTNKKLLDASG